MADKILIILGTQKFQLNRLLREIDELIGQGKIQGEVFAQIGESDYVPRNYGYTKFLSQSEFEEKIKKSTIVITHAGVGTIITALEYEKKVIVYPRLAKYGEHVDDHQCEIGSAFAARGYVLCCNETDSLESKLKEACDYSGKKFVSDNSRMLRIINDFLEKA